MARADNVYLAEAKSMAIVLMFAIIGLVSGELDLSGTPVWLVVIAFVASAAGSIRAFTFFRTTILGNGTRPFGSDAKITLACILLTNAVSLLWVFAFGFPLDHPLVILFGLLSPWTPGTQRQPPGGKCPNSTLLS